MEFKATIKNDSEIRQTLSRDFPNFARFAIANTASRVAFLGMEKSETEMRRDFTLRNKYVVSSKPGGGALKFNRAIPHHDIDKIESSWGSPSKQGRRDYEFLEEQEDGFKHSGPVPTERARTAKNQRKKVRTAFLFRQMALRRPSDVGTVKANDPLAQTWAMLRNAYKDGYGLPGSNQFFYMRKSELPTGMTSGWFQFVSSSPKSGNTFPKWKQIYYDGKNERRSATHWMENSKNKITQSDIEKFYKDEAAKAFTRGITRRW